MKWTLDKQLFTGLAIIVFLFNCTLITDLAWLWQGSETRLANEVELQQYSSPISWILGQFSAGDPLNLVGLRLPGLLVGLLGMLSMLLILRKILGNSLTLLFFLVLMNNYFLMGLLKVATADIWSFALQSIGVLSIIRFLKTPTIFWRIISYLAIGLAVWIQPITATLLFLLLPALYYITTKKGKQLFSLNPWAVVIAVLAILYFSGQLRWLSTDHYLGWGQSQIGLFLFVIFVGALPLLGFLLAGLVASAKNIRQSEEFSLLFLSWFGVALLTQSPSIVVVMSIFIARHIQDFFHKNYPYGKYIQLYSTLHLIAFFFVAAFLMLGGFFIFRGTGFRSGLAFSFVYWVLSFVLVIGIYGRNRRFVYAGAFLTILLTTTLFCLQVFPLLENQRMHRRVLGAIEERKIDPDWIIYQEKEVSKEADNVLFYLQYQAPGTVQEEAEANQVGLKVIPKATADSTDVVGWRDNFVKRIFELKKEI
ncbi:MAG TPA: hypothetical protein VJ953_22305 [Saprospiraceae bacterium]|nr:hypothetical protein [Saprospiraceae bacterium]